MLISKFDLYKPEWLELVFDDRNKEYGAYDLRRHYARNMVMAMGITFFTLAVICGAAIAFKGAPRERMIVVDMHPSNIPIVPRIEPPVKHVDPPKPLKAESAAKPVLTVRDVPPVVVPDPVAQKPIENAHIDGAIGQIDTKGPVGPTPMPVEKPGPAAPPAVDNGVHDISSLEVMPEPIGGEKAWAKFLNKNLRFPYEAQENRVSGRVILSFIIEKDGSLSNIVVERAAGNGFDEEALRVLKLAKAWKPGMQGGQPVRVKYDIPINFQLSSGDQ